MGTRQEAAAKAREVRAINVAHRRELALINFKTYMIDRAPGGTWVAKTYLHQGDEVTCIEISDEHNKETVINKILTILEDAQ